MNSYLQYFSAFFDNQRAIVSGSLRDDVMDVRVQPDLARVRPNGHANAHRRGFYALIVVTLLLAPPAFAEEISDSNSDFDEDGVPDQLDLDQDNDGILNSAEGYVSFANLADYPADSYVLLPDVAVNTEPEAVQNPGSQNTVQNTGSVFRYPLLNSRGIPSVEFVGTLVSTDTRVDWAVQQQLPKFKHLSAGQSEVQWQFMRFGSDEQLPVDVDLAIADLDGNRREVITVNTQDIIGYSVSMNTNLQINDAVQGKVVFTAQGESDNTENDAVILHLRNVSTLTVIYNSSSNVNVLPGLDNDAAGFRHNFTSGALEHYVPAPVVQHSDNDGYPDHRDLDSNNDGLPDAATDADRNRDGMVDGPVDSDGVPAITELVAQSVTEISQSVEPPREERPEDQIAEQPAEELPVNVSPASATLNIISDLDRDSIADKVEGLGDADGDGVPNQYDLDSDNDGLPDLIEAGALDADHNGIIDDAVDALVKTYTTVVPDFDRDGVPDFLDSDSDQDTLFDLVEAGGSDTDANGTIDDLIDQNGDGWDDRFLLSPLPLPDSDNDGNPDTLDADHTAADMMVQDDFQPVARDVGVNSDIVTGRGAAGCALGTGSQAIDPSLWGLLLLLQLFRWKRRIAPYCRRITHVSTQ